ncbi:MAG: TetR/AcrR family transcriptional regulator [Alicyclobacillus macrosporangiidus]|uniref:TetR/AcrR family transcriptional regulator n=1 Tax=Alicyclobacillus macrosporangiidus TaxID=392015 RepID=UPI0026EA1ADD|nr:TetR/AcrR family transcriptional regulator [Alicyclobacillus macrosporangiidus]MCL6600180.1 TetR/AcrR family transcriptional regulator [Alicyclobacillus macrosporangiidus]
MTSHRQLSGHEVQEADRRVRRTRKAFQEALLSLLEEKSYGDITVQDIARRADYNRVTFYAHFRDKDDLVRQVITEKLQGLIDTIRIPAQKGTEIELSPTDNPWILRMFKYVYENGEFFRIFYLDKKVPGFFRMLYNAMWDYFHDEVQLKLNVDAKAEFDEEMYTDYVTAAILGVIGYWVRKGFKYSPKHMAEQLTEIVYHRPHKLLIR